MVKIEDFVLEKTNYENHAIIEEEKNMKIKMYKCSSCLYTNKNAGTLSHHKKTHNSDQIPCEVCSKVFISRSYMQAHKHYVHDAVKVACHICSKIIKEFNLKIHEMRHTGYRHKCTFCSKSYMDQGSLFKHQKNHFPDNVKCNGCSRVFAKKEAMASHWERVHAKTRNFSCVQCPQKCHTNVELKSHVSSVHSTERSISCDQCPKTFLTQSIQHQHSKNAHTSKKLMFPCNQCDKIYKPGKGLKDHMMRIHNTELNFQCKYCNKMFKVGRVMKKHMNDIHEQVFIPVPCKVCSKMLFSKAGEKVHAKSHIEPVRIKCEMCPKMFKPSGLASHAKSHALDLIACDVCNKKVKSRSSLTSHKRIHTAQVKTHQCKMCEKKFTSSWLVQAHQLTHTEEKPYKCSYLNCTNSYNNGGSRSHHIAKCHKPING